MADPKYSEIGAYDQLVEALSAKNTVWLLILGDGDWTPTAIQKAKEQVTDQPQFMALWVKSLDVLPAQLKEHLVAKIDDVAACSLAKNLGVAARATKDDTQKGARLGKLLHQAEAYDGPGFCLTPHGTFDGKTCPSCHANS